jgi:hypothetical protein
MSPELIYPADADLFVAEEVDTAVRTATRVVG